MAILKSVDDKTPVSAIPSAVEPPSNDVLKQIGLSRRRWNAMTDVERLAHLMARVQRDKEKAAALAHLPQEPFHNPEEDSPVVHFRKTFGGEGSYEYVAVHVRDRGWLVSSQQRLGHMTWTKLLQWAMLREDTDYNPRFYLATGWELLAQSTD